MCLSQRKLGMISNCVRKHCRIVKGKMFWTYVRKVKISTSHKTRIYAGSTDDKYERPIVSKSKINNNENVYGFTAVDRFIIDNREIISLDEVVYYPHFYEDDCVEKDDRLLVKHTKEQLLLNRCRLEAKNDTSIIILNIRNPIPLRPRSQADIIRKQKPYICDCGYLKPNTDFTCLNSYRHLHCINNRTHLEWLRTQTPNNENDIEN